MNLEALMKLAGVNENQDILQELGLEDETLNNSKLALALKELKQEEEKEIVKKAAQEILALLRDTDLRTKALVNELRQLRQREKSILASIKGIERAKLYAAQTNNYIPLVFINSPRLGFVSQEVLNVSTIPADWSPEVATKPKARAK